MKSEEKDQIVAVGWGNLKKSDLSHLAFEDVCDSLKGGKLNRTKGDADKFSIWPVLRPPGCCFP